MFTESHVITFYTDRYDSWVVRLINMGFAPMMAIDKKSPDYFKKFQGVYVFWSFGTGDWTEEYEDVDVCITAPDGFNTDWNGVKAWLSGKSSELPLLKPPRYDVEDSDMYDTRVQATLASMINEYKYEERICGNMFLAEIRKPEVDQIEVVPYTVVIEDWLPDKMAFMFSSICSVPSFGNLYPQDRNFILRLWEFKNMEGKFSLQDLADKHVNAVKMGTMHEPVVYRQSIGEVIDHFNEMGTDTGKKRRREELPAK
jgi:hypothetical protein